MIIVSCHRLIPLEFHPFLFSAKQPQDWFTKAQRIGQMPTCVTSVAELTKLVLQAQQHFAEVYQSKDNKLISHVDWASNALQNLYYFMNCSHQIDEDISDILAATRRYSNRVLFTTSQTVILIKR